MNRKTVLIIPVSVIVLVLILLTRAFALNELTHELVNRQAAIASTLDFTLKSNLGLAEGLLEKYNGNSVLRWLELGGRLEDAGLRFFRHFHDPLEPWDRAGLRLLGGLVQFDSSIRWMQRGDQEGSWPRARRAYLTALTAETAPAREQAFAETFRALGQLMHLVVDASVPEHVRNDPHPLRPPYGNYEYWVSDQHGPSGSLTEGAFITNFLSTPISFDPLILQQPTGDARASVPVGRLIDTDLYTGADPNVTLQPAIGIAEVANANFFSEDTAEPGAYPFPDVSRLQLSLHPAPKTGRVRAYYAKGVGDGLPVDPVLAECVLDEAAKAEGVFDTTTYRCVDENVWTQTAQAMLPRAVGYSAALLDYFFRGQLRAVPFWDSDGIHLQIENLTDEPMEGVFELHAIRQEQQDLIATFGSVATPLVLGPFGQTIVNLPTSFTPAKRFALVFRGRLGEERPDEARGFIGGVAGVIFEVEFVFTVQETFQGPMVQVYCEPRPMPRTPDRRRQELLNCGWLPQTVRITGRFVTTVDRPIIQRIELSGGGSRVTEPRLFVDGVLLPGGEWVREDPNQPDPRTFIVEQTGINLPPLYDLEVTTRNETAFETELATIDLGGSLVGKLLTLPFFWSSTPDRDTMLVDASRSAFLELSLEDSTDDWDEAQFRAVQISGRPNPTSRGQRTVGSLTFPEGIEVDEESYDEIVIDHLELFPNGTGAEEAYEALPGLAAFVDPLLEPGPPEVSWTAAVERDYRPRELEFFRLFQIEPIFYTITLRGQ